MFFIHEAFLVYKMETFKNCQEVKHIIIMIIAIIYIFLSYMIFDQQLKITFRKFSTPPEKITPPFLLTPPPKNAKSTGSPFLPTLKIFQSPPPPCRKGGGHYAHRQISWILWFKEQQKIHIFYQLRYKTLVFFIEIYV